jgi:hypothetical protein
MAHIAPTPGRMVLFWPRKDDNIPKRPKQPLAAIVAAVLDTGRVNLAVFSANGSVYGYTDIPLIQDGEPAPPDGDYAEWMSYQKGQAAKTEAAELALRQAAVASGS